MRNITNRFHTAINILKNFKFCNITNNLPVGDNSGELSPNCVCSMLGFLNLKFSTAPAFISNVPNNIISLSAGINHNIF